MFKVARLALLVAAALAFTSSAVSAAPDHKLVPDVQALWTKVLETPSPQNAFGSGGKNYDCWDLGGIVAPLGPVAVPACTVKTGTWLLIAAHTNECSTLEGTALPDLATCAKAGDPFAPVTLDGQPLPITEVQTPAFSFVEPADNVLGVPAGSHGISVAHGWMALVHPLPPGTHTVFIAASPSITTIITVTPGK
jgi:hypothetical protein